MRLTAIYIQSHHLFSSPQILNLGGQYFYEITKRENEHEYDLTRYENPNFIENFWGNNISLVSAIVGENGSGKTSLLKRISTYENEYPYNFFIWEDNDELFITQIYYSSWSLYHPKIYFNGTMVQNKGEILAATQSIYYSPILNYEFNNYRNKYRTRFYNIDRATINLSLNSLLTNGNLNNFISENLINELIFCEDFQDFSKEYTFLNYNVHFSTILERFDAKMYTWYDYKYNSHNDDMDYIDFESLDKSLEEEDKAYYEEFRRIESTLTFDSTKFNNRYKLPFKFYIEFLLYLKYYYKNEINKILERDLDGKLDKTIELFFEKTRTFTEELDKDRFENIKNLYNLITQKSSNKHPHYVFSRKDALEIILLQEKIAFSIDADTNKISGSKFFEPHPINVLSSGEKALLNLFSTIYASFSDSYLKLIDQKIDATKHSINYDQEIRNIILYLDEADLGFHPQWKKKYIKIITDFFPIIFKKINDFENLQIIFTTHDPLTLSDIPNENIIYLKKDDTKTRILSEYEKPKKSFGANITDLLADSFFINDGLMGDFAKEKIQKVIDWLNYDSRDLSLKETNKKIIELIDEPILKRKLSEMYSNVTDENFELEVIEREIKLLNDRKKEIEIKHKKK